MVVGKKKEKDCHLYTDIIKMYVKFLALVTQTLQPEQTK